MRLVSAVRYYRGGPTALHATQTADITPTISHSFTCIGTCIGSCIGTHQVAQNNLAASVKALEKNVHFSVWAQHLLAIER